MTMEPAISPKKVPTMTVRVLKTSTPSDLTRLADDYLSHCSARGLSPRSEQQYTYSIHAVLLPWCEREGIIELSQLDRRAVDRFTSELLARTTQAGQPPPPPHCGRPRPRWSTSAPAGPRQARSSPRCPVAAVPDPAAGATD